MYFLTVLLEGFLEIYLFFVDYKFWKKKKAQRKYEKEHGLPKQLMIYPSDKIYLRAGLLLLILAIPVWFLFSINKNQKAITKQMMQIHELLKAEKKQFNTYPKQLNTIIRNNPLNRDLTLDVWDNVFYYVVTEDGLSYSLVSKGPDGILNTEDDVE
ncbi:hypothetical protein [Olleya namhaensis]|uniref:hypothetical protein n=1 Tax=Olleya namhaensis TaxID=1144750 RepID=UPI00232D2395|nr:hypothetical protein [Olleya namhaensis]